jgi:hypothetical protein
VADMVFAAAMGPTLRYERPAIGEPAETDHRPYGWPVILECKEKDL